MADDAEVKWEPSIPRKIHTFSDTGSGAMAVNITPENSFKLIEVRLHLGAPSATSENLTITQNSILGAAYDTKHRSHNMNATQDFVWDEIRDKFFDTGDSLDLAWPNTNAETWGLQVKYELNGG